MDDLLKQVTIVSSKLLERDLNNDEKTELSEFVKENSEYIQLNNNFELVMFLSIKFNELLQSSNNTDTDNIYSNNTDTDNIDSNNTDSDNTNNTNNTLQNINVVELYGKRNIHDLIYDINPKIRKRKTYLTLDSRYARYIDNDKKIQWDVYNAISNSQYNVNVANGLKNILSIRCASFTVSSQYISSNNRVSILIEELSSQSFVCPNNIRFHFIGVPKKIETYQSNPYPWYFSQIEGFYRIIVVDPQLQDRYICQLNNNDGYYVFNNMVKELKTITLLFGKPGQYDIYTTIPKYIYVNCLISPSGTMTYSGSTVSSATEFTITTTETIYLPNSTYLTYVPDNIRQNQPYSVLIDNFTTTAPETDREFINLINLTEWSSAYKNSDKELHIKFLRVPADTYQMGEGIAEYPIPDYTIVNWPTGIIQPCTMRINLFRMLCNFEVEYLVM